MSSYLLLTQSDVTARALNAWMELREGKPLDLEKDALIISAEHAASPSSLFERVAPEIHGRLLEDPPDFRILVDSVRLNHLNPLTESGWDAFIAMLVLAFPKVRWHFGVTDWDKAGKVPAEGPVPDYYSHLKTFHSLSALFSTPNYDPLMDASGLREWVRLRARLTELDQESSGKKPKPAAYIPARTEWAAALDDEASYAYFNAYTAYRWGFRAFSVNRNALAKSLFYDRSSESSEKTPRISEKRPRCHLTFEDIFLNYPDRGGNDHYSELSDHKKHNRVKGLGLLEHSPYRIFVSSSQTQTGDTSRRQRNRDYIRSGEATKEAGPGGFACEIHKPLSGMFDLWERSRLKRKLPKGRAPGFNWPPRKEDLKEGDATGHGAPGRLLQISEMLISQAEDIYRKGVHCVEDAVYGAVLTTDALELLGSKTPTTSIEALGLKHVFEVQAECQFSGIEYHIKIRDRLNEIARDTAMIANWFHPRNKNIAAWNAELFIVNRLVTILRENNQFDEEQICMHRARYLHHTIWMRQNPVRYVLWPILRYLEFLLKSFPFFLLGLIIWLVVFIGLYWIIGTEGFLKACQNAFGSFSGGDPTPKGTSWIITILTTFAVLMGMGHFGIFISHAYAMLSRR
jgi:hypothetical protein